jgi:uncharacterized GH25 family protein
MTKLMRRFCLLVALLGQAPLHAHEFWIAPVNEPLVVGSRAGLSLLVGENFVGDLVGFSALQTASLGRYTAAGRQDLSSFLSSTQVAVLQLPLQSAGTHLVAFDSQPNAITLSADSFHAYLHDEGLDFIKTKREAAGTKAELGRERYRRYVKTLLQVARPTGASSKSNADSKKPDMTHATVVGQRLELVPLQNPLSLSPGASLGVKVLFESKPLAGALLKAWHKRSGQTVMVRAITGVDGIVKFDLPYAGPWMISVVHMVPVTGVPDIDWDSFWGSLTFVVPPGGKL